MALRPNQIPDEKTNTDMLIAEYAAELEEMIDEALFKRHFQTITMKQYRASYNAWPALEKYIKARRVIYALRGRSLRGFLNVSAINEGSRRRLYKAVRKVYSDKGWTAVLLYSEQGIIYNIAMVK